MRPTGLTPCRWVTFSRPVRCYRRSETNDLFALALGASEPWYVATIDLSPGERRLDIALDFCGVARSLARSARKAACKACQTEQTSWRHLNFFEYATVLGAGVSRIDCGPRGKRLVEVPWARPGSGLTLLFEALVMAMAPHGRWRLGPGCTASITASYKRQERRLAAVEQHVISSQ